MKDLALHRLTRQQIESYINAPAHALMLTGPTGSGKQALAIRLIETILELPAGGFAGHAYATLINSEEPGKSIGIEAVRQLEQFLSLKVPGKNVYDRAVIIADAHLLTIEAQNALLKTLEEPPAGTLIVLTVNYPQSVLPTVRSRTQAIPVLRLERDELTRHFVALGFDSKAIELAYAISGGLPGLMQALLSDTEHPLKLATERARQLLSQSTYQRLLHVDDLAKQRQLATDVTLILQQMAHVSLQTAPASAAKKWQRVLQSSYRTAVALADSGQPKLALTDLMLNL